jgi:hypothetical protein
MASAGGSEGESPGWRQFALRRVRSDYSRANHAEEIRDVEDNVPPDNGRDAVPSVPFIFFATRGKE